MTGRTARTNSPVRPSEQIAYFIDKEGSGSAPPAFFRLDVEARASHQRERPMANQHRKKYSTRRLPMPFFSIAQRIVQVECTRMHTWDFECTEDGNQSYIGSRRRKCVLVRIRVHSTCNIICATHYDQLRLILLLIRLHDGS